MIVCARRCGDWCGGVAGTDILLGGNPDYMARLKLRELLMPEVVSQGAPGAPPGGPAFSAAVDVGGGRARRAQTPARVVLACRVVLGAAVEQDGAWTKTRDGKARVRTWAANPELFPCELSEETLYKAKQAIKASTCRPLHHGSASCFLSSR